MKVSVFGACLILLGISPAFAKPLLQDTQQTYFSACLLNNRPAQEQLEVCSEALLDAEMALHQRIEVKLELADAHYALQQYDAAEDILKDILAIEPESTKGLNGLAWVHWSRDEYSKAVALFEQSIALAPSAQALAGLGSSLRQMDGIDADAYTELLDAALALSPTYAWARREKGWGMIAFDENEAAEAAFRAALEQNSQDQWAAYGLGYALNEQERYRDAVDVLRKVETDQDTPTGYYSQLSLARYYIGDYKEALKAAERTIKGWPEDSTGYVRKARALDAMGRRAEAIPLLEARQAAAHDDFLAFWLSDLLHSDGRAEQAFAVAQATLEIGTPDVYDLEMHAFLALELGRYDVAAQTVQRILKEAPRARYGLYYQALLQVEDAAFDASEVSMMAALENGLPRTTTKDYLSALMAKGQYVRAIQFRLKAQTPDGQD